LNRRKEKVILMLRLLNRVISARERGSSWLASCKRASNCRKKSLAVEIKLASRRFIPSLRNKACSFMIRSQKRFSSSDRWIKVPSG
jgi:hypothetical protein